MSSKSPIVMARVVGTTPSSSSLQPLLTTLCKQISYNLDISYEDIPQDLVPLKTYFKVISLHKETVDAQNSFLLK